MHCYEVGDLTVVLKTKSKPDGSSYLSTELYDKEGNSFYCNFESQEDAELALSNLSKAGTKAFIGPCGPIWDDKTHRYVPNPNPNAVGVYIYNSKDKVRA